MEDKRASTLYRLLLVTVITGIIAAVLIPRIIKSKNQTPEKVEVLSRDMNQNKAE